MRRFVFSLVLLAFASSACHKAEPQQATPDPAESAKTTSAPSPPLVLAPPGVRFQKAGPDPDVAHLVKKESDELAANGRDVVVYVGAKWCEPCQRFHQAALRGDLDNDFPQLTILEFDLDEDRDRINSAGYTSKLIPLFVKPGPDGRASDKRFEGSIKGDGAVTNIAPRLRALIAKN